MITVSGWVGDGGGHVLPAAIALSTASGRPFRMTHVRGRLPLPAPPDIVGPDEGT